MAYFLVMGGLALSLCLLVGWSLWRVLRWLVRRLGASGKGRKTARAKRPAKSRAETRSMKKDETSARTTTSKARQATPRGPWRLTRALAPLASAWPLALVAGLLYGGTRLAEYGMGARPHTAPAAYHRLVEALGWGAIGLIGVAVVGLVASWRCR
ncbi:hypothetical protein DKQ62_01625 [Halomonas elongata]|uniref:hypothetical protein n=1 Tax=Halomonas elongata TaxID=2746 RepID=UPI000DCDCF78|nr:hypothetical protein [Halomonas elongata]RAW08942.1 hypothetical protein DKQ62_01625 [Halomonas elongata]